MFKLLTWKDVLLWCTQAFQAAWASTYEVEASMIVVPLEYEFLVGPISFSGPYCQRNIVFQSLGSGLLQWLEFTKAVGITVQGGGIIDGRGSVWWKDTQFDDPIDNDGKLIVPLNNTVEENPPIATNSSLGWFWKMPSIKPTALRFYGSFNVTVTGITIQNSLQCHLKFDNCMGVTDFNTIVSSPSDSPNTDGIQLQNSGDVLIDSAKLACGNTNSFHREKMSFSCSILRYVLKPQCFVQEMTAFLYKLDVKSVYIRNVNCGPGHGISIGGLGKEDTKACVSNITVRDIFMQNTMNGVRIKTWQVQIPFLIIDLIGQIRNRKSRNI
ncbi:hypothetical protein LguiA_032756 [Lonicera macranthoides]